MSDTNAENQLRFANTELNKRIGLLEKTLLEKERSFEALQDSEKRYRRLFESAKDGILILDAYTGKVVDVNPFLLQLLGYSYNDLYGQHIWELGVFKDIAASKDAFKTLQDNEYIRYDDLPLETRHGRSIAVEFVSNVYLVDHSKVIQCNIRDITERKRADREMAILADIGRMIGSTLEIHEVYERVATEIGKLIPFDSLIVNLRNAQLETVNVAYVSGLDIPGRRVGDSYPLRGTIGEEVTRTRRGVIAQSENPEHLVDKFPSLIVSVQAGMCSMMSVPLISQDEVIGSLIMRSQKTGVYTELDLHLAEEIGMQIAGAIANAELFNDLRKTEKSLRESEERLGGVIDHTQAGYFFVDRAGRFQHVNSAWLRMHGYESADEVIGRHFSLTQPEADMETAQQRAGYLLAGDSISSGEASRLCRDGSIGYHTFSAHPVIQAGEIVGMEGFIIDITAHRRLEENYRTLFREMLDGFALHEIICDGQENPVDYRFLAINPAFERMTGMKAEELVGRTVLEAMPGIERHWIETYGKVALTGQPAFFENYAANLNKHFKVTAFRPAPNQFACIFADITERKQAEDALRESEERFRKIFEEAHQGIVITSPSFAFEKANPAFCRMIGYSADELRSMTFADITHPDHLKQDTENVMKVGRGEIPFYQIEKRYIDKSGKVLWGNLLVSSIRDERGALRYYLSMVNDITERKQAEKMLREQLHFLQQLLDAIPIPIFYKDPQGMFRGCNVAYEKFVGMTKEQVVGKTVHEVFPQDLADIYSQADEALFTQPGTQVYETSFLHADGNRHDIIFNKATYVGTDGGVVGLVGVILDITKRKQAEEEKRTLEERLHRAEKMEALGQLAGGVAHDLNNVLGILTGYSELLLEEIPEGHRSRIYVDKILQSTEKGAAIIQDLLTLARRGVTASDVTNLNSIISGFLKTPVFEKMKDYHPRVTFRTECDKNLLNIKGSPVHLEKTLMNLVSNAAEAISGKGEVTIRTESRYLDKPVRGYDEIKEGDYAILSVSDTGTGILAENRERIFEPFYTKKAMGRSGTGLGLTIVWGTVKDHSGYIDVQTEVGEGTVFTLYFPVTREEPIAPQQKSPVEQYVGKGESVLVVDDIAEQRDVAARLLTRLGYEVHVVSSGEEAVEYLKGKKADILVLDMIMAPGIDGLETYQRVLEINPQQKAILVSGFSETDRVKEAQKLGAGAYVKKPYVMEKIGVAIRDELLKVAASDDQG